MLLQQGRCIILSLHGASSLLIALESNSLNLGTIDPAVECLDTYCHEDICPLSEIMTPDTEVP